MMTVMTILSFFLAALLTFTTASMKTQRLNVVEDVWLEQSNRNYNYHEHLIVGNIRFYPKKRSLLKFKDPPSNCKHIVWAKMYIYFLRPWCPSWIQCPYFARTLQVHQVLKSWKEAEATTTKRLNNAQWKKPWLALDDSDAYAHPAGPSVTMYPNRPASFVEFDVTNAVQNWHGGQPNHGLIVWATNENIEGRSLRFASNRYSNKHAHAFINVHCEI